MPHNAPTGYDAPESRNDYPRTYPAHHLEAAQLEYNAARGPMIMDAKFFAKNPTFKSWAKGNTNRFNAAQEALIKSLAKHTGKTERAVKLEFKKNADKAHEAASKIQRTYKKHKTGRGRKTRRHTRRN
jgi:hypothetical protein